MREITEKQRSILDAIKRYKREYKGSPTIIWLAKAFNIAGPTMNAHLERLEKKGYIKRTTLISKIEILK